MVTRVPAAAGDAIVFTEALLHVTLPWTVASTRTSLFYKYTRRGEAYSGASNFFAPSDGVAWGLTERTRAILEPPPPAFIEARDREREAARAAKL